MIKQIKPRSHKAYPVFLPDTNYSALLPPRETLWNILETNNTESRTLCKHCCDFLLSERFVAVFPIGSRLISGKLADSNVYLISEIQTSAGIPCPSKVSQDVQTPVCFSFWQKTDLLFDNKEDPVLHSHQPHRTSQVQFSKQVVRLQERTCPKPALGFCSPEQIISISLPCRTKGWISSSETFQLRP